MNNFYKNGLVSIIMPAYNAGKYIDEAVQSVFAQTWQNWELIIVNDGSTDDTVKYLNLVNDPRIRIIHQENRGVSSARNTGLDIAKGDYITFFDADDVLPPNSIEERVRYIELNNHIDIVDGIISFRDEKLKIEKRIYIPSYTGVLFDRLIRLDDRVFAIPSYLFKKEVIGKTRFKDYMFHSEDILFFIELSMKSRAMYGYVNELICIYRTGHYSAMANIFGLEKGYIDLIKEIKKINFLSKKEFILLKIKVSKIIFLCWAKKKCCSNSIYGFFKIISL